MFFTQMLNILFLAIFASAILPGLGSIGDRSMDYKYCLKNCIQGNCSNNPTRQDNLSWTLRLFLWTCGDDCQYSCMHQVTSEHAKTKRPIRQFYGKVCFIYVTSLLYLLSGNLCSGHLYDSWVYRSQHQ